MLARMIRRSQLLSKESRSAANGDRRTKRPNADVRKLLWQGGRRCGAWLIDDRVSAREWTPTPAHPQRYDDEVEAPIAPGQRIAAAVQFTDEDIRRDLHARLTTVVSGWSRTARPSSLSITWTRFDALQAISFQVPAELDQSEDGGYAHHSASTNTTSWRKLG